MIASIFISTLAIAEETNEVIESITTSEFNDFKITIYIIIGVITILFTAMNYFNNKRQFKEVQDNNRKHQKNTYSINMLNNTLSTVKQSTAGEVRNIYTELKEALFDLGCDGYLWDEKKSIKDILELNIKDTDGKVDIKKEKLVFKIRNSTHNLLNFYDCIATSIESELVEPAMIFNHYSLMVIDMYRWAKPIIDEENAKDDFTPWYPFQQMAKAYIQNQNILKDELHNHKNSIYTKQVVKVK